MICLRRASLALLLLALVLPAQATWISPFISEIHYDNVGLDKNEFVAVTGPGELDLTDWQIVLYNGATNQPYGYIALSGRLGDPGGFWAERYWPFTGIQNGPDAVALVSPSGLIDFVAYEGVVSASGGGASGSVARLLPVSEGPSAAATSSLQRAGTADSWIWLPGPATPGLLNSGLTGFADAAVPAMNAWQLWLAGFFAWLLSSGSGRLRSTGLRLQLLRRCLE
jgi:hypothetical protein